MRRLEFHDARSAKFWEVEVVGLEVTTRWGRIGSTGQSKTKEYSSPEKAKADADKQHKKKVAKGYAEPGTATKAPSPSTPTDPARTDLADGEEAQAAGSGGRTYTLKNVGGVYSCTCPAWLHQSIPVEGRTCKHLRRFRGEAAEAARLGSLPEASRATRAAKEGAPKVLLAHSWSSEDPTGWWMSEKLDGVRAWWDGQQFLSRQGNRFLAPDWFVAHLPNHPLDGEIFAGRGRFQHTVSVARRADAGEQWQSLRFLVFDAPDHDGRFEERMAHLGGLDLGPHADVLPHEPCTGTDHLTTELARIEALGGEGVMLRKPGSRYVWGRSETLLKVKTFHDAEAVVVEHLPGTGKHRGRLGALRVQLPDGTLFKVGTGFRDAERERPPAIGSTITFRYQELTNAGVPRFPSFLRVRTEQ